MEALIVIVLALPVTAGSRVLGAAAEAGRCCWCSGESA